MSTNGRNDKENYLREYEKDSFVKSILYFVYNDFIVTGISSNKISKLSNNLSYEYNEDYNILKLFEYLSEHNTGRDCDLEVVEQFAGHNSPYNELVYDIVTKNLKLGISAVTLNKVYGKSFIPVFDLMLAQKYFDSPEKYLPQGTEFMLTTKLDGVRCVCINDPEKGIKFFSRQGKPIYLLNDIEEEVEKYCKKGYVYDGELLLVNEDNLDSKDLYRATIKVTNSDNEKKNVIFNVFDKIPIRSFIDGFCPISAKERKEDIHNEIGLSDCKWLKEVSVLYSGTDQEQIHYWLNKITSEGGEGVMINLSDKPYECKRSQYLLKVKKMQTADLLVLSVQEGTGTIKGKLGNITVKFIAKDGNEYTCDCGSGFKMDQRELLWNNPELIVGKIVEIQYFEMTQNADGKYSLRFPVFLHIREDKTEISMY